MYILDTDMLTLFQEGHAAVLRQVAAHPANELAITVLSVEEQLSGWYTRLRRAKNPKQLAMAYERLATNVRFLSGLQILNFDEPAIGRYEGLGKLKLKIRKMDLRIAAVVLERDAVVVTRNLRDFRRVPRLRVEDWSK
jgi:tRNA(fMet)-specific endonuclease VapC